MRIAKIASGAKYRIDEQFQNLLICGAKFWFSKLKENWKFVNFIILKTLSL